MIQQQEVEKPVGRAYYLSHPKEIDRTKVQHNRDGEVVPFNVTKFCTKCNTTKNLWEEFHFRASSSDLHQSWCKECVRKYKKGNSPDNQGGKLLGVPASTKIHVGHGVRAPETQRPALSVVPVVPVVTEQVEPSKETATPVAEETEVFAETTAPVAEVVKQDVVQPTAIASVTAIEEHTAEQRGFLKFAASTFVDFQDWITDPAKAKSMFMTRGAEAIVTTREDGMCWIVTPNQSGPGQWIGPELAAYILKLLTGENTEKDFVGLLYR